MRGMSVRARADFVSSDELAPVCHVAEIGEQHLLVVRQRSRLLRRGQHRFLRCELLVKVGHVLRAVLQQEEAYLQLHTAKNVGFHIPISDHLTDRVKSCWDTAPVCMCVCMYSLV